MIDKVQTIGFVETARFHAEEDFWGEEEACISLTDRFTADALERITDFSHVEVLYLLHKVELSRIVTGARHPRNNMDWPSVGIFAQRAKNRPNRIGSTFCRVIRVEGTKLFVAELDAIQGTPVFRLTVGPSVSTRRRIVGVALCLPARSPFVEYAARPGSSPTRCSSDGGSRQMEMF